MRKAAYFAVPLLMLLCFWAGQHFSHKAAPESANPHRILYYVDPMHPAYKSDKPGIAPDCGMQLEPVYADAASATSNSTANAPGTISISPEQQQLIGLRVETVTESAGPHHVRVLGRVTADESRLYRLNAATDGYIQTVMDHPTGSMVDKETLLASFGATEIMTAQQTYVSTILSRVETSGDTSRNPVRIVYASRLRALGMSDIQLKELGDTMKVSDSIQMYSPVKGFILARNFTPGQRFEKGAELYRIADLTKVWIVADVYESEAQNFKPGTIATVMLPSMKKSLRARVSDILPQFDPVTRTMKLRLEADNPGFLLRPDMFADIELPVQIPAGLTVPADSLLDSGTKKRVFLDRGNGTFEPREVETGWRFGDRVQVVSGLAAGDRIVVSGTFLVDSESRLKAPQRVSAEGASQETAPSMKPADMKSGSMPKMKPTSLPSSAKDPSCGMNVKPAESVASGFVETYKGKQFYFCSTSCRDKFHKDPEHYLASKSREAETQTMEMPMEKGSRQ